VSRHLSRPCADAIPARTLGAQCAADTTTVADYTAQALISSLLFAHFDYPLVGEEDAQDLRSDGQSELRKAICTRADAALAASRDDGDEWKKLGSSRTEGEWLDAIDRGNAASAAKGRTWCLDPIVRSGPSPTR